MTTASSTTERFTQLLQDNGFQHGITPAAKQTRLSVQLLAGLAHGTLAPNHPYLPTVAERLHIPENTLREFANGNPMSTKEEKRLAARLANSLGNGHRKNGNAHPSPKLKRQRQTGAKMGGTKRKQRAIAADLETMRMLTVARAQQNLTLRDMADWCRVSDVTLGKIERGETGPNNPVLEYLAPFYGVPAETMRKAQRGADLNPNKIKGAETRIKRLTARAKQSSDREPKAAKRKQQLKYPKFGKAPSVAAIVRATNRRLQGGGNGDAPPKAKRKVKVRAAKKTKRQYTRRVAAPADTFAGRGDRRPRKTSLRGLPLAEREQLRTLLNTVNVNAMKGIEETTVRTEMLATFFRYYFAAIGVEDAVVLDTVFDHLFG
jgi:transcriptional regulator with XRE-family HTH domain/plasmid maintenance system antidote protein VapI